LFMGVLLNAEIIIHVMMLKGNLNHFNIKFLNISV